MPIYDNDGVVSSEISKLYDNNGSTSTQIGKVYDNDGSTSILIYSAETIIKPGNPDYMTFTMVNGGLGSSDLDLVTSDILVAGVHSGYSHNNSTEYKIVYIPTPLPTGNITFKFSKTQGSRICQYAEAGLYNKSVFTRLAAIDAYEGSVTGSGVVSGTQYLAIRITAKPNSFGNNEGQRFGISDCVVS